jgi:hypothetical protein
MRRFLVRWLATLFVVVFLASAGLQAQVAPQPGSKEIPRGYHTPPPAIGEEVAVTRTPAFAYTVAGIFVIVIMTIVCTPSRKLPA